MVDDGNRISGEYSHQIGQRMRNSYDEGIELQLLPEVEAGPDGLLFVLLVFVEVGVGEEDGDLLLTAAVEEAEAPGRGLVVGVEAAVDICGGYKQLPCGCRSRRR